MVETTRRDFWTFFFYGYLCVALLLCFGNARCVNGDVVLGSHVFACGATLGSYHCYALRRDATSIAVKRFLVRDTDQSDAGESDHTDIITIDHSDHITSAAFALDGNVLALARVDPDQTNICTLELYRYIHNQWAVYSISNITLVPTRLWKAYGGNDSSETNFGNQGTVIGMNYSWGHESRKDFSACRIFFRNDDQSIYVLMGEYRGEIARWSSSHGTWIPACEISFWSTRRIVLAGMVGIGVLVWVYCRDDSILPEFVSELLWNAKSAFHAYQERKARRFRVHFDQNSTSENVRIHVSHVPNALEDNVEEVVGNGMRNNSVQTTHATRDVQSGVNMTPQHLALRRHASQGDPRNHKWDIGHWLATVGPEAVLASGLCNASSDSIVRVWGYKISLYFLSKVCRSQYELQTVWQQDGPLLQKFFGTVLEIVLREGFARDSTISQRIMSELAALFGITGYHYYSEAASDSFDEWWHTSGKQIFKDNVAHRFAYSFVREAGGYYQTMMAPLFVDHRLITLNHHDVIFAAQLVLPLVLLKHTWDIVLSQEEFIDYCVACCVMHGTMRGSVRALETHNQPVSLVQETFNVLDSWGQTQNLAYAQGSEVRDVIVQQVSQAITHGILPAKKADWLELFFAARSGLLAKNIGVSYTLPARGSTLDTIRTIISTNTAYAHGMLGADTSSHEL